LAKKKSRAYEGTEVPISRSRAEIERLLRKWGVTALSWVDDYETGMVVLRFRWKSDPDDKIGYTARFTIHVPSDEELEKLAIDKRSGNFSEKKMARLRKSRGKRQHRLLLYLIKTQLEAIEDGIMLPEQVFMSWIEDETGMTLFDRMLPELKQISGAPEQKALEASDA